MNIPPVYHFVPQNLEGDILYPLNQLKDKFPSAYFAQVKKYEGREWVMDQTVPHLHCLWNDVIHTTPIHPSKIREAYIASGFTWSRKVPFYEIDPVQANFTAQNAVIYLARHTLKEPLGERNKDFIPFNPDTLTTLTEIPEATQRYYREMKVEGRRPLLFVHVPHVLYRGRIETQSLSIIEI